MSVFYKTLKPVITLLGVAVMVIAVPISSSAKPLGMPNEQGLPKSLADLIEHVSPAVVNIRVITGGYAANRPREDATEGQGSGFIVTSDGKIVTNFHVIEGGDKITVDFANGEEFEAKIIGTDHETDIAVIQIQAKRNFDYVGFYHGPEVRIGDWVLAIGNPFGIGQSSSVGIISATLRKRVESGSYVDYLQTDATVNRGNSGGPLFNFKGEVIGVNSAIFSPTGASVGIAFAVPHTLAEEIVADIIKYGKVKRGFLGAALREAEYTQNGAVYKGGATINSIGAGTPAEISGLQVEDVILRINNTVVRNAVEATRAIGKLRAGDIAIFEIERGDTIIPGGVRVNIAERPDNKDKLTIATGNTGGAVAPSAAAPAAPKANSMYNTGLSLVDLGATFRESIGMRVDQVGVYVDSVALGSNAARKGIKSGMVILEADGKPVASVRAFGELVRKAQEKGQRSLVVKIRTLNASEHYTSISLN
ncbi:MAG: trypsin-like peptidase domain-containing protein [Robiginitomaculum sp.]|nr:trypsin-like peptidase domain-containing protein [Robiginitomaculum sp.]